MPEQARSFGIIAAEAKDRPNKRVQPTPLRVDEIAAISTAVLCCGRSRSISGAADAQAFGGQPINIVLGN